MSMELALADRDPAVPDESAIREVRVPRLWPPLGQEPAAGADPGRGDHAKALTLAEGAAFPQQFAVLLAEGLAGVRPVRQLAPWLSKRGSVHLHRLLPLFSVGQQPRVQRVLTTRPAPDVIEMTMIAVIGHRTRALAIRLERGTRPGTRSEHWLCTDIEAA
jgi:hypothetical protein